MSDWLLTGTGEWIDGHAARLVERDAAGNAYWRRHGIAPLMLRAVKSGSASSVAPDTLHQVEARCRQMAALNLQKMRHLAEILAAFDSADVPVVTLKGPVLAVLCYGDLARREFVDLDLLVEPDAVDRAWERLVALGYEPLTLLSNARQTRHMRVGRYHQAFVRRGAHEGSAVELHWALLPPGLSPLLDARRVWSRTRIVPIGGVPVRALGAEDLAVFLALHGAKHGWCRLLWIADFAHVMARELQLDWGALIAGHSGAQRSIAVAVSLAARMTGGWLPKGVDYGQFDATAVKRLVDEVWDRRVWHGVDTADLDNRQFQLAALGRPIDRWRYYAHWSLHPSTMDLAAVDLPHGVRGLYYVIRPLRLVRDRLRAM
jgi:Uncharacterised nucleotidyltransferase